VIVYELLAGRTPFESDTPVGLLYAHVHSPPPPLAGLVAPGQEAICDWVEWLLAKDPAARPQSAAEAWDALEELAVAEMGPYWRRNAAISAADPVPAAEPEAGPEPPTTEEAGEDPTRKLPTPTPIAPAAGVEPARPRRRLWIAAATVVAGAAAAAAFAVPDDPEPERPAPRTTPPPRAATPYDFDSDGRQELVIAMLRGAPRARRAHSGVVLVQTRGGKRDWSTITEARAGIVGRPKINDDFGSGLASADFDRDGHADLAIGTPGRERVSVLYGGSRGLGSRTDQFPGGRARLPAGSGRYGYTLLARDFDADGYGDLLIGAPGQLGGEGSSGALHLVFGGKDGLRPEGARIIRRPAGVSGFGHRLRSGDVDGDGRPDLVEGGAARGGDAGHASYCRSAPRGPLRCRLLPSAGGTSSLAIGDVNGDDRADIIQGDSQHVDPEVGPPVEAGLVRVWLGSRDGPSAAPFEITQDSPRIPDVNEPGDEFGAVVEAGDVDSDGFADIIVAAVREDGGAGQVTVIRGGRDGYARVANVDFDQDSANVPGRAGPDREFGSTIAVLRLSDDDRPDVAVAARGESSEDARVMVVRGSPGVFSPTETRTRTLEGVASLVDAPPGGRIRLARTAGS
jgi:hypothetical protein